MGATIPAFLFLPRQVVGFALSLLPFAGMLLVLSAERDERNVAGVKF